MTTHKERFINAVTQLTGRIPPESMVDEWLGNVEVNGAHRLQDWVGEAALPGNVGWAQNIAILDAAEVLAEQPIEGDGHQYRDDE